MRAVVVYESMYGNTHLIAEAIGDGLGADGSEVTVVPVEGATPELLGRADLVVVGGPTHAHGMTRAGSRHAAVEAAGKDDSGLEVDPDAEGPGLRDWFHEMGDYDALAAAFDTRFDMPAVITGQASKGIRRQLKHHGFDVVADPESFFVTRPDQHLAPHEEERARTWGQGLITAGASRSSA
jgi:hypothetical protein